MKKTAVCVGTFDPLTVGHLWVIKQGSALFDRLIVATGDNPDKDCMFSVADRLDMLSQSVKEFPNVEVGNFNSQSIVTYAWLVGAQFMLRGIRTLRDYQRERIIRNFQDGLDSGIPTVVILSPRQIARISSTLVRKLIGRKGWETKVKGCVPEEVFKKLKQFT